LFLFLFLFLLEEEEEEEEDEEEEEEEERAVVELRDGSGRNGGGLPSRCAPSRFTDLLVAALATQLATDPPRTWI